MIRESKIIVKSVMIMIFMLSISEGSDLVAIVCRIELEKCKQKVNLVHPVFKHFPFKWFWFLIFFLLHSLVQLIRLPDDLLELFLEGPSFRLGLPRHKREILDSRESTPRNCIWFTVDEQILHVVNCNARPKRVKVVDVQVKVFVEINSSWVF